MQVYGADKVWRQLTREGVSVFAYAPGRGAVHAEKLYAGSSGVRFSVSGPSRAPAGRAQAP